MMKAFLTYLVSGVVEHEDQVKIKTSREGDFVGAAIEVHPDDIGRLIGKEGKVIRAIRALARAKAALENQKVRVEIVETDKKEGKKLD